MKFNELQKTLGTLIVERAQLELGTTRSINGKKVRRVASGDLRKNLQYTINGKNILFGAKPPSNDYASFVHYGVNGTEKSWGSPYSFKNNFVGSKMVSAIEKWMKAKGVKVRGEGGKFVKQTDSAKTGMAFAIAKAKKKKGTAPLPYYDMAIKYAFQTQQDLIEKALVKDIELNLDL